MNNRNLASTRNSYPSFLAKKRYDFKAFYPVFQQPLPISENILSLVTWGEAALTERVQPQVQDAEHHPQVPQQTPLSTNWEVNISPAWFLAFSLHVHSNKIITQEMYPRRCKFTVHFSRIFNIFFLRFSPLISQLIIRSQNKFVCVHISNRFRSLSFRNPNHEQKCYL